MKKRESGITARRNGWSLSRPPVLAGIAVAVACCALAASTAQAGRNLITPALFAGFELGYDCVLTNLKRTEVVVDGFQFVDDTGAVIIGIGQRTVPPDGFLRIFSGTNPSGSFVYCRALNVAPRSTTLTLCVKEALGLPNDNDGRVCVSTP